MATAATPENDFGYALVARNATREACHHSIFEDALAGSLKMLWIIGQNPAVTMANLNLTFQAISRLACFVPASASCDRNV